MRIDIYHHFDPITFTPPGVSGTDAILAAIQELKTLMSDRSDALNAAVTADTDATSAAVTAIHGLMDQIAAANGDQQAIDQAVTSIRANAASLAAAITANTPAAAVPDPNAGGGATTTDQTTTS